MDICSVKSVTLEEKDLNKKEKLNIGLFLAGRLVSLLGTNIYSFALSLYILKSTNSGMSFALSIFLGMLPRIILGPFAGSLADRAHRKRIVVGFDLLSGLSVLGLLGISQIWGLKIIFIYVANVVLSIINTFFDTTLKASLPNLVRDKSLVKINSYSEASSSLASIIAPIIGGLIFSIISINLFLLLNGLSFILSAISEMFIDFKFNKIEDNNPAFKGKFNLKGVFEDTREVLVFLKNQKTLFTFFKTGFILNFFVNPVFSVIYPYIMNKVLKMSSFQFGFAEGAFSIGIFVTSVVLGKLPEFKKKYKIITIGILIMGIGISGLGFPTINGLALININASFIYYVVLNLLMAVFLILINVPFGVVVQRITPDEMLGRVMALLITISMGISPIGVILAGVFVDKIPPYVVPFISGTVLIIISAGLFKNKLIRDI